MIYVELGKDYNNKMGHLHYFHKAELAGYTWHHSDGVALCNARSLAVAIWSNCSRRSYAVSHFDDY